MGCAPRRASLLAACSLINDEPAGTWQLSIVDMAITKTPLPDAAVLGEFAIVAAENARRLLTDAENLLTRGGWPTAHSLALLALEEAGQVLAVPDRPGYAERAEG